jgi:hypothetical protein
MHQIYYLATDGRCRIKVRSSRMIEVIGKMKEYLQMEPVLVIRHADRIGSNPYNLHLLQ